MPFHPRGNRRYFYQSVRVGDRVKKVYFGGGITGELAAEELASQRYERKLIRQAELAILAEHLEVARQ